MLAKDFTPGLMAAASGRAAGQADTRIAEICRLAKHRGYSGDTLKAPVKTGME
jgi:hypothetical protein